MSKKMTKKEMFAQIMANHNLTTEEKDFVLHEIELLEKRNSKGGDRKPTAKQTENEGLKTAILDWLTERADEKFTITEIWKGVPVLAENPDMSNQRVSAVVRQLVMDKLVVREEDKRKAYFTIAKNEW